MFVIVHDVGLRFSLIINMYLLR